MQHSRTRVLIVDDERAVRTALELAMPAHFEVCTAESAEAALTLMDSWTPDLMLVDKNLPGISGIELLRRLKGRLPVPPWALLMTGFSSVQSAIESLDVQVYGYIEKPFRNVFDVVKQLERLADLKLARDLRARRSQVQPARAAAMRAILLVQPGDTGELISSGLRAHDVQAVQVSTVDEAARRASAERIDLFVIDGRLDGGLLDVIHRIREKCPTSQFVVAHDKPSFRLLTQLIQLGVVRGVLELPGTRDSVTQRLGTILESVRAEPFRFSEAV